MRKFGVFIIGLTFLMAAVWASNKGQPEVQADSTIKPLSMALSQEERVAIVKDANRAINQYAHVDAKERKGNEIPQRFWGDAILSLKPVRVVNDRVNVAIVLQDDDQAEQGLYVTIDISSYAPGNDKRFAIFEKLSKPEDKSLGDLYRYSIEKPKDSKAS